MSIQHVSELFILDGEEFIASAYRNLLGRDPDQQGMTYYLARLSMGYGKSSLINDLVTSNEAKPENKIVGIDSLVIEEKRARSWFFGARIRKQKKLRLMQMQTDSIINLINKMHQVGENLTTVSYQIGKTLTATEDMLIQLTDHIKCNSSSSNRGHTKFSDDAVKSFNDNYKKIKTLPIVAQLVLSKAVFFSGVENDNSH
ncbi:MAG: DUF4214 domain-containing protein [Acidithiobacillus ferrivorans]